MNQSHIFSREGPIKYCAVRRLLLMIGIGAILSRRVFVVFGALGVTFYLGYISYNLFRDSYLFPILLSLLGFAIIYAGILWNRYGETIGQNLRSHLPSTLQTLLARRQNH